MQPFIFFGYIIAGDTCGCFMSSGSGGPLIKKKEQPTSGLSSYLPFFMHPLTFQTLLRCCHHHSWRSCDVWCPAGVSSNVLKVLFLLTRPQKLFPSAGGGGDALFFSLRSSSAADVSSLSPGLFSAPKLFAPSLPDVRRAPVLEERRYHGLPFRTPQVPQI